MKAGLIYVFAIVVMLVDQASKYLVIHRAAYGSSIPFVNGAIEVTPVKNSGGAFGMMQSMSGLITLITFAAIFGIVLLAMRRSMPLLLGCSLGLVLGGAMGNLIDRLRYGYVVDFINLRVWPVFNFADVAITLGVFLMAYDLLLCEGRKPSAVTSPKSDGRG